MDTVKGVVILGSTGSIGRQTLDVIESLAGRFRIIGLAAGRNVSVLAEQARQFKPRYIFAEDGQGRRYLEDVGVLGSGQGQARWVAMEEMVTDPDVDLVMVATVGRAGLSPTLAAIRAGKNIALANKETLVMAGHIVTEEARRHGVQLLPVDSEHSAIWQCLWGEDPGSISRLILTASGGAFRDRPLDELARVSPEEALRHPTWNMGRKITIDSATLLNKGFEVIEARWLFDIPYERIDVVLHRESIIHSLVEFCDGCLKAQLGLPDMREPIQCALCYPQRVARAHASRLDLGKIGALHFAALDTQRYPCVGLALEAGRKGGTYPAVLAAADETAVDRFLAGYIGFLDIARVVEATLSAHKPSGAPTLEAVLAADDWARRWTNDWIDKKRR